MKKVNQEILEVLKNRYEIDGPHKLAKELNLSVSTICVHAKKLNLKSEKFYSDEDIEFLKMNYEQFGSSYCSKKLSIKIGAIVAKATSLGLSRKKSNRRPKQANDYKVNPNLFLNIKTKEIAYLLGFLWADGTVHKGSILTEILKSDFDSIKNLFSKTGQWAIKERTRKNSPNKPLTTVSTHNHEISDFLRDNHYDKKRYSSANDILSKIPSNLQYLFFRGWIDGDGTIDISLEKKRYRVYIWGSIEQNWDVFNNLLNKLEIKFSIKTKIKPTGSYSFICISNKAGIKKICDFIYQNFNEEQIGFNRKYAKYEKLKVI